MAVADLDLRLGRQLDRRFVHQSGHLLAPHLEQLTVAHQVDVLPLDDFPVRGSGLGEAFLFEVGLAELELGSFRPVSGRKPLLEVLERLYTLGMAPGVEVSPANIVEHVLQEIATGVFLEKDPALFDRLVVVPALVKAGDQPVAGEVRQPRGQRLRLGPAEEIGGASEIFRGLYPEALGAPRVPGVKRQVLPLLGPFQGSCCRSDTGRSPESDPGSVRPPS